jgi:hypothetical protein
MKFKLHLDCGNAAFDDGANGTAETARILRELAGRIEGHGTFADVLRIYDINGNHVGEAVTTGKRKGGK